MTEPVEEKPSDRVYENGHDSNSNEEKNYKTEKWDPDLAAIGDRQGSVGSAGRRQSVALNIVENPLKVSFATS